MAKQLSVTNLPFTATSSDVQNLFTPFGKVAKVKIEGVGKAKTAYVEMVNDGEADTAVKSLAGAKMGTNLLNVAEARPRTD